MSLAQAPNAHAVAVYDDDPVRWFSLAAVL